MAYLTHIMKTSLSLAPSGDSVEMLPVSWVEANQSDSTAVSEM